MSGGFIGGPEAFRRRRSNPSCAGARSPARIEAMHDHSHGHGHSHGLGGHSHVSLPAEGMTLILGGAVVATFALVGVELIAGYAGHSIALVSDAVHNLTDVPTLVLSWFATRWAKKPPTPQKTYGYHRSEEHTSELQSRFDLVCRLLLE